MNAEPWQCRPEAPGGDPLVGAVRERLAQGDVRARNDEIDSREVRCFTIASPGGDTNELCATEDGVPVLVSGGESKLRLVALETDVDPTVFQPPG